MTKLYLGGHLIDDVGLVIFDKDGTLMDLYHYWSQMIELRAAMIAGQFGLTQEQQEGLILSMGVDRKEGRILPQGPVGIKRREDVRSAAVNFMTSVGYENTTIACEYIFDQANAISEASLYTYIRPLRGARALLVALSESGCKVAIATTDRTHRADIAIRYMKMDPFVDFIVGTDMVKKSKPDPEMIYTILGHFDLDSNDAVIVGDAATDVQMGKNARLKASIGVASGVTPRMDLEMYTEYVVSDISNIQVFG
jgi:phosphoglycolate phosphatase-like HAD superfamily hydrolase